MEVLNSNIDVLAHLFEAREKGSFALDAVNTIIKRISASFGRGDVNVFRGNSPSEPDNSAIGESGSKKKPSLIDLHFKARLAGQVQFPPPEKLLDEPAEPVEFVASRMTSAGHVTGHVQFPSLAKSPDGYAALVEPVANRRASRSPDQLVDKLVSINRVAKVVKGGKRFGFAALVVVGDQNGQVGFGHGKAREVPEAIRKATEAAKKNLTKVPLREGRTLHHDIAGRHGAGKVYLRSAPSGTGIIAGGPMRAVFETLGIQDVVAKSIGSSNPYNMVRATFDALKHQDTIRSVAARRNIKVSTLLHRIEAQTKRSPSFAAG
jgi:small subunit ribosomal protein S5